MLRHDSIGEPLAVLAGSEPETMRCGGLLTCRTELVSGSGAACTVTTGAPGKADGKAGTRTPTLPGAEGPPLLHRVGSVHGGAATTAATGVIEPQAVGAAAGEL